MILGRAQRARIQRIARGRSDEDLRLLEGPKAIAEALSRDQVVELWLREGREAETARTLQAAAAAAGVPVGLAPASAFDRLGDTVTPQGALALVNDTARPIETVLAGDGPCLWLDGVQDPGNVGAVVRVAAAFGWAGLLAGEGTADPLGLKALRASAGLALVLPFARASAEAIEAGCRDAGREVWTLDREGEDLLGLASEVPAGLVLAVGAEGGGLGMVARRAASRRMGIPIAAGVESLNAAVAVGIAVAQLSRGARP